ncbi:MAG: hypothetical protein L7S55_03070, partial [Luminiphilus sp.]|nr:hypothetical protein [Luminiphilus sp.]
MVLWKDAARSVVLGVVTVFSGWSGTVMAEADWVLRGGPVYSMDNSAQYYSAIALTGNRIVWLGEAGAATAHVGPQTRVIELDGRSVLPG